MIPYERRQILLNELEKQDMVTLSDFARALHGVSESTIRRDLKILEGEGQIVLLRGGAAENQNRLLRHPRFIPEAYIKSKKRSNRKDSGQTCTWTAKSYTLTPGPPA